MNRNTVSFEHPDISGLAKYLRKELFQNVAESPRHTEVLNVLSRSRGHRNFQSYKQVGYQTNSRDQLAAINVVNSSIQETFLTDGAGEIIDRRHADSVDRIQFAMNVTIELGHVRADAVLRAIGKGHAWTFDSEYVPDEDRVAESTLAALGVQLMDSPASLFGIHSVEIPLSKSGNTGPEKFGQGSKVLRLNGVQFAMLERLICEVNAATTVCEAVVDWLQSVAQAPDSILEKERKVLRDAANYLDAVVEVSGEPAMYSWNREKMAGIRHALEAWADGERSTEYDRKYVFDNLYVFSAPRAWTGEAPMLSEPLANVVYQS